MMFILAAAGAFFCTIGAFVTILALVLSIKYFLGV